MKSRTLNRFFFQLALSLQLSDLGAENVHGEDSPAANTNASAGIALADAEIKTMLRDYIDTDKLGVGLVIGIVDEHGARVVSHGKLDNGTDRDVDGNTLFEIGSITKVFTALLLQDMVERGEMKLDDPVQKYLPDSVKMPTYQGKEITLLHLATHTSGLPRNSDGEFYRFLSRGTLRQAPGTRQEYSNLGMALLGHALALKAGQDYDTLVIDRICRPLGMDSTRVEPSPELKTRLAMGHAIPGHRVRGQGISLYPAAGALRSTANDLLKFVSAYAGLSSSPLNSLMQKAQALHSLESGAKQRLVWEGAGTVFEHGGLLDGYQAELAFDVRKRRAVVVLANCANWSTIVPIIWRPLLEARSPKPANGLAIEAEHLDRYVGQYRFEKRSGIFTIRREGERLLAQWGVRVPPYEIFPLSETVFRNEFWGVQAQFLPAGHRKAPQLVLTSLGPYSGFQDPIKFTRFSTVVPEPPVPVHLDSSAYDAFVGQYRKTFLFGLIRVGPTLSISHLTDEVGDHLIASVQGLPGYGDEEFFPLSETRFIVSPTAADDVRFTFVRNKKGKTTRVNVYWNGTKLRGARISNKPAK